MFLYKCNNKMLIFLRFARKSLSFHLWQLEEYSPMPSIALSPPSENCSEETLAVILIICSILVAHSPQFPRTLSDTRGRRLKVNNREISKQTITWQWFFEDGC